MSQAFTKRQQSRLAYLACDLDQRLATLEVATLCHSWRGEDRESLQVVDEAAASVAEALTALLLAQDQIVGRRL